MEKKASARLIAAITALMLMGGLFMGGLALIGCGGSDDHGQLAAKGPAHSARHRWRAQPAGPAMSACRAAVAKATSLSDGAKREIAAPCETIDERVLENEAIVRAVCQELATASSSSPTGRDGARIESQCYAGYARTIPGAARR